MQIQNNVPWLPKPNSVAEVIGHEQPNIMECTSAFVFAFKGDSILLSHVLKRGYDIIGGHIEWNAGVPRYRETPLEAVIREAKEETGATLMNYKLVGHRRMHVPNPPVGYRYPTPFSYAVYFTAEIVSYGETEVPHECGEPKLFTLEQARNLPCIIKHMGLFEAALSAR